MVGSPKKHLLWSGLVFVSKLLKGFSNLLIAIFVARAFGAESSGQYFLVLTIVLVSSQIAQLGFHQGVLKFTPFLIANQAYIGIRHLILMTTSIALVASIILAGLLNQYSEIVSTNIFRKPEISDLIKYMSLVIIGWTLFRIQASYLQSRLQLSGIVVYENLILPLFLLGGLVAIYLLDGDIVDYGLVTGLIYILLAVAIAIPVFNSLPATEKLKSERITLKRLLIYSLPLMAAGLIQQLVLWSDTLMIGYFMKSSDVGIYNAGMRIALATTVILYVSNTVLVPFISKYSAEQDWEKLKQQYHDVAYYLVLLALPVLFIVIFFGKWILGLFGDEFVEAYVSLLILMIGQFINIATGSAGYILMMTGKEKIEAINIVLTLIINIIMNLLLIPEYGIVGAAISTSVSLVLVNLLRAYQNHLLVGLPWLSKEFLILIACAFLALILITFIDDGTTKSLTTITAAISILVFGIYQKRSVIKLLMKN